MIVSENPNRSNPRWLRACVLACVMVVLPLGIVSAQDYEAVGRRLDEAVSNGELSLEQAGIMLDTLRKAGGDKKQAPKTKNETAKKLIPKTKSGTDLDGVWKKLQAMVEAGEITQEQAVGMMSAIKN